MDDFRWLPESASSISGRIDQIYLALVAGLAFFTVLICVLILGFGIRYRRGSPASRRNPPHSHFPEYVWSGLILLLVMVPFVGGARIYFEQQTPPAGAREIQVVAKQWMWKAQHPNGRAELNELHVPINHPVRLRMISEDVIHSFYVPAFRVKQDVLPGYYTQLWFEATRPGRYHLFCAEYCGTEHSRMRGTIVAMRPDQFADWLAKTADAPPDVAGRNLFELFRCGSCHAAEEDGVGPSLVGLFGSQVSLEGEASVEADEPYLRAAILDPARQVVAGYRPDMPTYRGQINELQVLQLIAYLKTLQSGSGRGTLAPKDDEP